MTWLYPVILFFLYLVIGGFIAGVWNPQCDGYDIGVILCWPLVLLAIVLAVIVMVPAKLGKIIGGFIRKRLNKNA